MEIRLRPLVVALIVLALVGALGCFAWPRLLPLAAELRPGPVATLTVVAPVAVPTGGPDIPFLDESLGWDWKATCAPQFRQFLAEKLPGRRIGSLKVVLVDYNLDSKLPFGVRYPDEAGAQADANCYDLGSQTDGGRDYTCSVGVERGEPGANLDVAATLAAPICIKLTI